MPVGDSEMTCIAQHASTGKCVSRRGDAVHCIVVRATCLRTSVRSQRRGPVECVLQPLQCSASAGQIVESMALVTLFFSLRFCATRMNRLPFRGRLKSGHGTLL